MDNITYSIMTNTASLDDLLEFLTHASERGLMPAATAQALAVACRNVFGVLDEKERAALPVADLEAVIKRFANKRAKDFNPTSLKEYGLRVKRAVELYLRWRQSPADFSVKTRSTRTARRKEAGRMDQAASTTSGSLPELTLASGQTGYPTAFPIRPGQVVTISNIPYDLSAAEAERFALFVRLLAPA